MAHRLRSGGRHVSLRQALGFCLCVAIAPLLAQELPDEPALEGHVAQELIDGGRLELPELLQAGHRIFVTRFNRLDGQGRPDATGDAKPTSRIHSDRAFVRTSGPDANSCGGCHHQPGIGGSGEFGANVFVLAQLLDPVTESISSDHSNQRNSPSLMGSGAIEMLAREMTHELLSTRSRAERLARSGAGLVTLPLLTKGVSFGAITVRPNGLVDGSAIQGVGPDLVIRPFSFKGVVTSLREFTINAMNHHAGMQAIERFGWPRTGRRDFDGDGVPEELTVGDVTACVLFQAALPIPRQIVPRDSSRRAAVARGEVAFRSIGCTSCHVPELRLSSRWFSEPNPYNRPGNLLPHHVARPFRFDLTRQGLGNRLERERGGAVVRAYTDLKRHRICDASDLFFCNERLRQDNVPVDEFLTTPLWHVGSSAPYGHAGDLTTLSEAILHHSAEARAARDAFARLPLPSQRDLIAFLRSLRAQPVELPADAPL